MKRKILCILFFAASLNGFSQAVIGKQKTIGGNADDQLGGMWLTHDGGMILGGRSYSDISDDKTEINRGIDDYWVVKLNSSGNVQWQRTLGGADVDEMLALQQTADGGYILAGNSQSNASGDKTENSKGVFDCWIIKLDKNGNMEWQKTLGGDSYEFCNSVQQTADGGYIVGCMSVSDASGDKAENSKGNYDFWLVKLDANGNKQWDKTLGGSGYEFVNKAIQTADGGYLAVGLSNSDASGDKSENSRGGYDYWAIKLDRHGNKLWDKTIGGTLDDYVNDVVQTPEGAYALCGASASGISGDKTENSRGGQDYWLVVLSKNGQLLYQKTMGGSADEYGQTIENTIDGSLILGGSSASPVSGEKTEDSRGFTDYWVIKLGKNGHVNWDKTIGSNGDDDLRTIKETSKNNFVFGGYSWGDISGEKTSNSYGGYDYWVIGMRNTGTVNIPAGADAAVMQKKQPGAVFSVYPNPAKDIVTIRTGGKAVFSLTDVSGKILSITQIQDIGTLDLSKCQPGIYFIKDNTTGVSQRIIITR